MTALVTVRPSCWNKPRPAADATYVAQAGWAGDVPDSSPQEIEPRKFYCLVSPRREAIWVDIKSQFGTIPCQVGKHDPYPCCAGCQHNTKGA